MQPLPPTNRRDFLSGRALLDAVPSLQEDLAARALGASAASATARTYLVAFSRPAMACEFEILLNAGQYAHGPEAALAALEQLDELEAQLSVYRPASEINRLNRTAASAPQPVEGHLFQLLALAVELYRETGGAFDVTTGPLSRVWGFYSRAAQYPEPDSLAAARQLVGSDALELQHDTRTVRIHRPGLEINLGSIGKGYALDRCGELLDAAGIGDYLLHGGQSSVVARGSRSGLAPATGWKIALRHPLRSEWVLGEISLVDRGLGTSGSGHQFFYYQGRRLGHVLDPRTGMPVEGVLGVTAIAPTGAQADALATAFFVMGCEATADYCRQHPDLGAIFVLPGERAGTASVVAMGAATDLWTPGLPPGEADAASSDPSETRSVI